MHRIPTLWKLATWLKVFALILALFVGLAKILTNKLPSTTQIFSFLAPFVLLVCSIAVIAIAPELPPQMTMSTLWRWIEICAYIGTFLGGGLLFKKALLGNKYEASKLAFDQMRM